ncbi:MAG: hypothetical protein AAF191_13880 [Verrucomicrobiota bacterium]
MDQMLLLAIRAFVPAGLLAALCWSLPLWDRSAVGFARQRASLLALVASFLWAYLTINQLWVPLPKRSVIHWLPWGTLGLLGTGLLLWIHPRTYLAVATALAITLLIPFLVKIHAAYPDWSGINRVGITTLVLLGTGSLFALAYDRSPLLSSKDHCSHVRDTLLLWGWTIASSVPAIFLAGSSKWAQVIGVLGIVCGLGIMASLWKPKRILLGLPFQGTMSIVLGMLLLYLFFFVEDLPLAALLIFAFSAPVARSLLARWSDVAGGKARYGIHGAALFLNLAAFFYTKHVAPPPSFYGY